MSDIVIYANDDLSVTTGSGTYRVELSRLVSVGEVRESNFLQNDASFSLFYPGPSPVPIVSPNKDIAQGVREIILAHWDSYLRHRNVYENSSSPPKTTLLDSDRFLVEWGGNTVIVYCRELDGIKDSGTHLLLNYRDGSTVTFMSTDREYLDRLHSGIKSQLQNTKR